MTNCAFDVYRKLCILFTRNIHISDMLECMNISSVYIYGMGEIGEICCNDLENYGNTKIISKYDKKYNLSFEVLNKSNDPIIITPVNYFNEIRDDLISNGIDPKRLLSLPQIFLIYEYLKLSGQNNFSFGNTKEFLIVGAGFDNKGSEAMAFVTIKELNDRFKDCIIWLVPNTNHDMYKNNSYRMICLDDGFERGSIYDEISPRLTAVIDISGYALSSEKGFGGTTRILTNLRKAYDYNTPYYFMPQSYGPIDYPKYMLAELKELFSSARIVYTRESYGNLLLKNTLNLKNTMPSYDLVLQNKSLDKSDVYFHLPKSTNISKYKIENGVIIVPNTNLLRYRSLAELKSIYKIMIDHLLYIGKQVHIVPHSDDTRLCEDIYSDYTNANNVYLWNELQDSFEFSDIVKHADFIIGSRYHAIIHSYKCLIPCIALGWAAKYNEQLSAFDQKEFSLEIRSHINSETIITLIDKMEENRTNEKEKIKKILYQIQNTNCFDILNELI